MGAGGMRGHTAIALFLNGQVRSVMSLQSASVHSDQIISYQLVLMVPLGCIALQEVCPLEATCLIPIGIIEFS